MATDCIDLCVGWGPWPDEAFLEFIVRACALRKLSLVICKDENVHHVLRASQVGRKQLRMYLDADADYDDPADAFHQLGYAARDGGGFVVNEPDRAKLSNNKAVIHYHFERARIPVPYTIVVRNWEPSDFKLTSQERKRLGRPFIIKPARGYGKQGVTRVSNGSVRQIAKARRFDRGDDFLLQEFIEPAWFGHRRAWFRAYYVLGQVVLCWWDNFTEHYEAVTLQQFQAHGLAHLCELVLKIVQVTHMNFFSTELAITGQGARRRVVSVDYINSPVDMTVKSQTHCGVPNEVVRHLAERIVHGAWRLKCRQPPFAGESVWFAG